MTKLVYMLLALALFFPSVLYAAADGPASVIVLDPGHGGEDTGAVGPGGVAEKDINLKVALMLAGKLRERLGCEVLLTRAEDVFISLEARTAFANASNAEVFISIHANATSKKDVNGVETYFLSFEATDEDARRAAAFENSVSGLLPKGAEGAGDLDTILMDLVQTGSHHESSKLAEELLTSMLNGTGKENRGIKQAPFLVLIGATMPAVLVEVGFISNPSEEKRLSSPKEQSRIADSIMEGVVRYYTNSGGRVGHREASKAGRQGS